MFANLRAYLPNNNKIGLITNAKIWLILKMFFKGVLQALTLKIMSTDQTLEFELNSSVCIRC